MNERIKELCEQAKAYANESTKHFTGDEPVVWMDYYTERFTKLIVKDYAKQLVQANMSNREYAQAMDEHYEQKWAHRFD